MNSPAKQLIVSLLLTAPLVVQTPLLAQGNPAAGGAAAPGAQGPIDIQANEQEFVGDQVIARGNVRVKYKDSVVFAPMAQLYRDPSGNPQRAVFTGHPHLTQGLNKIDAEKLTFEVANSRVVAEGHAHSEVVDQSDNDKDSDKPGTAGAKAKVATTAVKPAATSSGADATNPDFDPDTTGTNTTTAKPATANGGTSNKSKAPPEKIITDSDRQEYDRSTGKFEAIGHVRVVHGDILVKADKLQLVYGLDNKPETALFTGNVAATQDRNTTCADKMIYSLSTRRLQATGHVKSTVIQERKLDKKKSAVGFDPLGTPTANAAESAIPEPQDDVVVITSNTQDYSKDSNRMTANGNVRIYYQDMVGAGPAAVLIRNAQNKAERIILSGRSQISQPTKRWIADHIEMTVADKKILATGNTKAVILQPPKTAPAAPTNSQLARSDRSTISATRVETAK